MPPLPKVECPWCHRIVALRKHGELREHYGFEGGKYLADHCEGEGRDPRYLTAANTPEGFDLSAWVAANYTAEVLGQVRGF